MSTIRSITGIDYSTEMMLVAKQKASETPYEVLSRSIPSFLLSLMSLPHVAPSCRSLMSLPHVAPSCPSLISLPRPPLLSPLLHSFYSIIDQVQLFNMSNEKIEFKDSSFDTIVDTFGLCSVHDPIKVQSKSKKQKQEKKGMKHIKKNK